MSPSVKQEYSNSPQIYISYTQYFLYIYTYFYLYIFIFFGLLEGSAVMSAPLWQVNPTVIKKKGSVAGTFRLQSPRGGLSALFGYGGVNLLLLLAMRQLGACVQM